jgi:tRNA pseudouridine38-40 synthase
MVRNLIGSLVLVGSEHRNIEWIEELLDSKDRKKAGKQFPASGLYLVNVEYDHKYNLNKNICYPKYH